MISIAGILLIILAIGLIWCVAKHNLIQGFVGNMAEVIRDSNCPDYMVTDGAKFYLIYNNKDFDGVNNPMVYDSLAAARLELTKRGCKDAAGMEPIVLRRQTNHDDPTESYERSCAKHTANPLYWLNDCAFGIAYKNTGLEMLDPTDLAKLSQEELAKRKTRALESTKKLEGAADTSDKFKLLRQLNDFLNSQDTATQVNYDIETCMIEKVGKEMPELGGADKLQKFNKYFNVALTGATKDNNKAALDQISSLDEQALADFDKYFTDANELAIPQHMMDRIFGQANN